MSAVSDWTGLPAAATPPLDYIPDNVFWEFMATSVYFGPLPLGSPWTRSHSGSCTGPSARWIGDGYLCRPCALSLYWFRVANGLIDHEAVAFINSRKQKAIPPVPSPAYSGPTSPVYNYPASRSTSRSTHHQAPRQLVTAPPQYSIPPKTKPKTPTGVCRNHTGDAERYSSLHRGQSAYAVPPVPTPVDIKGIENVPSPPYVKDAVGQSSILSQHANVPQRRRGSHSSDASSASSSFRECFSSSSSGSDGEDGNSVWPMRDGRRAGSVAPSHSKSRKITGVVCLGKTQRKIRRLVDALLAFNNSEPSKSLGSTQLTAQDAAAALVNLSTNPRNKAEIVRRLTKGAPTREQTLRALCALSDSKVDIAVPLQGTSPEARLIDMVMEVPKMGPTVATYLADTSITGGAAGIRHLMKTKPSTIQGITNISTLLLSYVERLMLKLPKREYDEEVVEGGGKGENHLTWITFRLLELLLYRRIIHLSQLKPGTLYMISYSLSYFSDQLTPYQVVRSFGGSPPPAFRPDAIYRPLYETVTRSRDLFGGATHHEARCLAFSALAAMLCRRYCSQDEDDGRLVQTIVDVLLWKTSWQHSITKALARSWDIPLVIPHDDAYAMLSLVSPSKFFPVFRNAFKSAISDGSYQILKPLIALIVNHSASPDAFWPTMLNALVQAGMVDYMMSTAVLMLPGQDDRLYRVVQDAKRDAVTGVLRCFEQIPQTDSGYIGWRVFDMLEQLITDEAQPLPVQDIAKIALRTWDQNMGGIRPPKPVRSTRLR
ncbi:hypothetical protein FRB95_006494 [Tulasnella sp. JGI-2019a]|nr:hypothetical protein FRB95_006494 [Tulasnella sp. JGI-2019a]